LIHRRENCMSPVITAAPAPSPQPVSATKTQGINDPASQLGASTSPASDGQPNFSAVLSRLFAGTVPAEATADASIDGTPGATPLPKVPTAPRTGGRAKNCDATASNPAAAIAANLLPAPAPQVSKGGPQSEPPPTIQTGVAGAFPLVANSAGDPGGSPIVAALPIVANPKAPGAPTPMPVTAGAAASHTPPPIDGKQAAGDPRLLPATNLKPEPSFTNIEATIALPPGGSQTAAEFVPTTAPTADNAPARETSVSKDPVAPVSANAAQAPRPEPIAPTPPSHSAVPVATQIHESIAGHLDQLQQQGRIELQLNLHPPELGRVQLHLTLEDGHLNVRMVVQDENARRMIDQQLEPLRVRFADMGVSVGQFDVRRDGGSPNPEQKPAAEPSAQAVQAVRDGASRLQKTYGNVAKSDALVDVIA
jgi:Flagellar hook-length control protein FliK